MTEDDLDLFNINPHRLDEECVNQPRLRRKYGDLLAEAKRTLARAEKNLEEVKARTDFKIRKNPEAYGLTSERITENMVKVQVLLNKKVQQAEEEAINAQYEVDKLSGDVSAIEHRKTAIQDLTKLRLADYYADPKIDEEARHLLGKKKTDRAFRVRREEDE